MRTPLEKKIILMVIILVALASILAGIVIWPTVKDIRELRQESEEVTAYLERRAANAKNLHLSTTQSDSIRKEVAGYDKYLFKKGDELKLITALEKAAADNNIEAKVQSSNLDGITKIQYVELTIRANGEYHHLLKYLSDLEKMDYFININNMTLSSATKQSELEKNIVHADFKISLYEND